MEEQEKNTRLFVLEESLKLEKYVNYLLGELLDIDWENSRTLGYKSTSLSLFQKVLILIDIKTLESTDKKVLEFFMNIRNQFMHNHFANNFENCIENIDGLDKWLNKRYPNSENKTKEEYYKNSYLLLSNDVFKVLQEKVFGAVLNKMKKQTKIDFNLFIKEKLEESLNELYDKTPALLKDTFEFDIESEKVVKFVESLKTEFGNIIIEKIKNYKL